MDFVFSISLEHKCIVFFWNAKDLSEPAPILLDGRKLPWVKKINHLGCTFESDLSMKFDILIKRGQFIGKVNSIFQEFHFIDPIILLKLINSYATTFYGSCIWNLQSKECEKLYNAWNVTIRTAFKLDRKTHRYLVEPISGSSHLKTILLARYANFYQSLVSSPKFVVRFMARLLEKDQRSVLGRTLQYMLDCFKLQSSELFKLTSSIIKSSCAFEATPEGFEWVPTVAHELLDIRNSQMALEGFRSDEIDEMLNFVCTV